MNSWNAIWAADEIVQTSLAVRCGGVELRPLLPSDVGALAKQASDANVWRYSAMNLAAPSDLATSIHDEMHHWTQNSRKTFVVSHASKTAIGTTSLGNYSAVDRRIEIGWTWLGQDYHGCGANTLAKCALLQLCFDAGKMERVEFKTDVRNSRARAALRKIGATEEGILRSHTLMPDGRRRDTIYYSVLRAEWPLLRRTALAGCPDVSISM